MKSKFLWVFLFVGLFSLNLCAKKKLTGHNELAAVYGEIKHYFDASFQFYLGLHSLRQKYNLNMPEIMCNFCQKRSLPCNELIVKVQARFIDKAVGVKKSVADKVHEQMLLVYREITDRIVVGNLEDIKMCMVKIAQDNEIPCEDCENILWLNASEQKDSHEHDVQKMQKNHNP